MSSIMMVENLVYFVMLGNIYFENTLNTVMDGDWFSHGHPGHQKI